MSKGDFSEDALVEQPAIALFAELGWQTGKCFHEFDYGPSPLRRDSKGEVVLVERLRPALQRLNPDLPNEAVALAIEELTRDRSAMGLAAANREIYQLPKNGVRVSFRNDDATKWTKRFGSSTGTPRQTTNSSWLRSSGWREKCTLAGLTWSGSSMASR